MLKVQPLFPKLLLTLLFFIATSAVAQPKVTMLNPQSGPAGTMVTITGTGFNATASANIVYFGAVQAQVTGGSATSLTVQAPAGATYQPVSVLNTATGLTGFSARPYLLTFTQPFGPVLEDNFYKSRVEFSSGGLPLDVSLADIDGDGKPDIVAAIATADAIAVYRNTAAGGAVTSASFAAPVFFSVGTYPSSLAVADADGDGKLDIIAANASSNTVSVLHSTSTPGVINTASFAGKVDFAVNDNPSAVAAGDVDGDGRPDIVVASRTYSTISVLRNTSAPGSLNDGSFAAKVDFTATTGLSDLELADIDGDGKPDIVTANYSTAGLSILRNTAVTGTVNAGSFAARVDYTSVSYAVFITTGDLNGDGKPEIVVPSYPQVLTNTATPGTIDASSLSAPVNLDEPRTGNEGSGPVRIGDADGDGKPDIAVSAGSGTTVAVFHNLGSGGLVTRSSFDFRVDFATSPGGFSSARNPSFFGDVSGDGVAELLTAYQSFQSPEFGNIQVFQIGAPAPVQTPPSISGFSPRSGPVGASVTITGADFNASPSGNIVYFGSVKAVVTAASATSLTVTVPPGTTYQPISVLNTATGLIAYTPAAFNTTFTNPFGSGISSNFYQPPVAFGTNYAPASVAVADLDGDGKTDIVVGNYGNLSVLRNTSLPGSINPYSFATKVDAGSGIANTVSIADMDGDGKPDLISTHNVYNYLSVIRNTSTPGTLSFETGKDPYTGRRPSRAAIGDLDGDGKPDIVVANAESGTISVIRNRSTPGNLSFASKVDFGTSANPQSVAIADFNKDGKPDLAVTISGSAVVSIFMNKATGAGITAETFSSGYEFATGTRPAFLEAADLNADGKIDLVMTSSTTNAISILQNNTPDGFNGFSFSSKIDLIAYNFNSSLAVADLDGDGKPDLAVQTSTSLGVLRNTAAAGSSISQVSFAPKVDFSAGFSTNSLAAGDLDGDGIPELLATNSSDYSVSVLRINASLAATPAPQISAVTPAAGPVGTTVTITGSNFNTTPSGNIVYFGATRATVLSGSATSLQVTVPGGATYQPVSVLNSSNGLTGYGAQPFDVTYQGPAIGVTPGFYQPKVDVATGSVPFFAGFSDLDGDGKPDLITANAAAGTVSLLRNMAAGNLGAATFGSPVSLPVGSDPRSVATTDLDGDGKPDLVVANAGSGTLSVLRNVSVAGSLGAASFAARTDFATGANPYSVTTGDVDGDGKPDLVAVNFQDGSVSVLRNLSTTGSLNASSFAPAVSYPVGAYPRFVIVRDLNGDNKPEIIVVNEQANTISVLRNTAVAGMLNAASLAAPVSFATGTNPDCVAAADFDGDGKIDLASSNFGSNNVSVLRNIASGNTINASSFSLKTDYATGSQPFFLATGDADGDGKADILVANAGSSSLSLLRNASSQGGNLGFGTTTSFNAGGYPVCVALGDADGDNIPELVSANAGSNSVSLLKVANLPVVPVITSFSPASGGENIQVTITGNNFASGNSNNIVYFGAAKATVVSSSATSLTVIVPAGATYKPLSVTVNGRTGFSSKPFALLFPNPSGTGIQGNFYKPKVDIAAGSPFLFAVAFGDLDRDGKTDMVGVNKNTGVVSVLRNISVAGPNAVSTFSAPVNFTTNAHPQDIKLVDLDSDGDLDIVTVNPDDYSFTLLRNNTFESNNGFENFYFYVEGAISTGTYISSLTFGDLDKDGKPDAVVTNLYAGTISVLRNLTTGFNQFIFAGKVDFAAGNYPRAAAISDADGDGRPDIVVANERGNSVSVFRNLTDNFNILPTSFAPRIDLPAGNSPSGVAAGDADGDGKPDLVVSNYGSNTVSVLRNTSTMGSITTASFAGKVDFATGSSPYAIVMGDADGDGKTDLLTANTNDNTISVLRNTAASGSITAASFAGKVDFGANGYPLSVALGDLNGDGLAEAAAANAATGTISVFQINAPVVVASAAAQAGRLEAIDAAAATIQLYPNPTRDAFTVRLRSVKGSAATVELIDESGKAIERRMVDAGGNSTALLRFSLRTQPAGVYYVKVTGADGVRIMKVAVQR